MSSDGLTWFAGLLYTIAIPFALLDIPVALILVRAAWRRPRITLLSLFALLSVGIASLEFAYIVSVANGVAQALSVEMVRVLFRATVLPLALFPPLFLLAYYRDWFRDAR